MPRRVSACDAENPTTMAAVSPAMSPLTTNIAVEEAGAPLCGVDSGGGICRREVGCSHTSRVGLREPTTTTRRSWAARVTSRTLEYDVPRASVAQGIEQEPSNLLVAGSNPAGGTTRFDSRIVTLRGRAATGQSSPIRTET